MPKLSDEQLLERAGRHFKASQAHTADWRREAKELFDFVAGRQWDQADEAILTEQHRPIVTFNVADPMLESISGVEINNRQEIHFDPSLPEFEPIADVPNTAIQVLQSRGNCQKEESDAFRNSNVCGIGIVDHYMDFDRNPDGDLVWSAENPLAFYWDPMARKQNLSDSRWRGFMKRVDQEKFNDMWPDKSGSATTFGWNVNDIEGTAEKPGRMQPAVFYDGSNTDKRGEMIEAYAVFQYDYFGLEPHYRMPNADGSISDLSQEEFAAIQRNMPEGEKLEEGNQYLKYQKRVYYRAFISGETVLEHEDGPCQSGFPVKTITGRRDHTKGIWYGAMKAMRDPCKWLNKFFSQDIHKLNSAIKGGLWYEESALQGVNENEARANIAKPTAFVKFADGALSGGRVMKIEPAQYQTTAQQQEFALRMTNMVTGLNLEFMGLAGRDQPGVLEQQRKMASMTILAPTFASLREYRMESGALQLEYLGKYYSTPRLQKMVGQSMAQYVPAFKAMDPLQFELILDDAPESPSMKSAVWATFLNLAHQAPEIVSSFGDLFIQYAPGIPADLSQQIQQRIAQKGQKTPEQAQMEGAALGGAIAKAVKDYTQAELNKAQALAVPQSLDLEHEQHEVSILTHHTGIAADLAQHAIPSGDAKLPSPSPSA